MPVSFWIISTIVFIAVSFVSVKALIKYYSREYQPEWVKQRPLNIMVLLRGTIPLCVLATILIMSVVRIFF